MELLLKYSSPRTCVEIVPAELARTKYKPQETRRSIFQTAGPLKTRGNRRVQQRQQEGKPSSRRGTRSDRERQRDPDMEQYGIVQTSIPAYICMLQTLNCDGQENDVGVESINGGVTTRKL